MAKARYFNVDDNSDEDTVEEGYKSNNKKKKSDKREETYVSIGTPLPEIEDFDAAAKKETRPVIQARVHGEKILPGSDMPRLHGAFTGGFSAGYFNTVGSKEGFVPSTFVSTRQQRAQAREQRPSDYMDEEDVSEHGIAPREVKASETFSSLMKAEKETSEAMKRLPSTVIPELASSLANLVTPAQSNIGIRLLISMGWRHGQGTGACVSAEAKKKLPKSVEETVADVAVDPSTKMYGCSLPPGFALPESDDESGDEGSQENLPSHVEFAPSDLAPYSYVPKSDVHGLGYSGMKADEDTPETSAGLFARPGKRGIRGHAFGVGFEGEDPEDTDIYGGDSMKNYDFSLDDKEERNEEKNVFSGWTAPALMPPGKAKPVFPGTIDGFAAGSRAHFKRQSTNLPKLPPNYKPIRGYISKAAVSSELAGVVMAGVGVVSRSRFDQREVMTASTRAAILESGDDSSIRAEAKNASVFDYISPEDKFKLQNAVAGTKKTIVSAEYEQLESRTISSAPLKPFDPRRPFASDEEKQSRYEAFLQFKQINKDYSDLDLPTGMTEWERQQEREQFERSARLLQPLSWSIAQRFTRASSETTAADDDTTTEVNRDDVTDNLADKKGAVKMKMFGKLTRSVLEWHPAPLLCKRFNVRNPYPDSQLVGLPKVRKSKFSIFNFLNVTETAAPSSSNKQEEPASVIEETAARSEVEEEEKEEAALDTSQLEKAEEEDQRPSMDIFAAIFGEESESGEESEETPSVPPPQPVIEITERPSLQSKVLEVPPAPPVSTDPERDRREEGISAFLAGIFGSQAVKTVQKAPEPRTSAPNAPLQSNPQKVEVKTDEFGPKLPLHLLVGVPTVHDAVGSDSTSISYSEDDVQVISSDSQEEDEEGDGKKKEKKSKHQKRHHRKHSSKHHGKKKQHHSSKKKDSKKKK